MKRIALIMNGWWRYFTYAWPSGILQRLREGGEDANLYIFNASGDWSLDPEYNVGEFNIFNLPDLKDFDGIILDLNNIAVKEVRDRVIEAAKKSGRPVLSIANEIEDFYYVGIDNYAAIWDVIDHLHTEHGCESFWFAMGDEANYENAVRMRALREYMDAHGIAYGDDDFYCENYEFNCGVNGFARLRSLHPTQGLPDAIICANDNIAVGVCEAAEKEGFHAPDDFLVTGFDNFDKAGYYSPHITTVAHVREEVGYKCADILLRIWNGETVGRFNYTATKSIFWESCGCDPHIDMDYNGYVKGQIMYGIETDDFDNQITLLDYEMMHCSTVQEMIACIPKCVPALKCDAIYLVLDDHLNDYKRESDIFDTAAMLEDEPFHKEGYPSVMNVEFAYVDGENLTRDDEQIASLFPMFDHPIGGVDFLFLPMHFGNQTVGYLVIRNAVYLMEKQYLSQITNTLSKAMENLHKAEKLEHMNTLLSRLYLRDSMTGLYNRIGYQNLAWRMFDEHKQRGENLLIIFVDMDRLKYINDNYGHEHGDFAIKTIAQALLHYCPAGGIPIRTGGDEFLMVLPLIGQEEADGIVSNIRQEVSTVAKTAKCPYPLTISVGMVFTDMKEGLNLDNYVSQADAIMYEEKVRKKAERRD